MKSFTPKRKGNVNVFEAHAGDTIGGYLPQVLYSADGVRSIVVWQGELVAFSSSIANWDPYAEAMRHAERRIAEVIVGLFDDGKRHAILPADAEPGD